MSAVLRNAAGRALADVLGGSMELGLLGVWHARLELDVEEGLVAQAVTLEVDGRAPTPAVFGGAIRRAEAWQGRARAVMVGGAGGLLREVPPREYVTAPTAAELVADVVAAAGERVDASVSLGTVGLPRWSRAMEPAAQALGAIARAFGLGWRMLDTGAIWVGVETWPAASQAVAAGLYVQGDDGELGVLTVAPDDALVRPGTTVLGRRIRRVVFDLGGAGLRAELHYDREAIA